MMISRQFPIDMAKTEVEGGTVEDLPVIAVGRHRAATLIAAVIAARGSAAVAVIAMTVV